MAVMTGVANGAEIVFPSAVYSGCETIKAIHQEKYAENLIFKNISQVQEEFLYHVKKWKGARLYTERRPCLRIC